MNLDWRMTSLHLPNEIIAKILLHLASVERLEHVLRISRRFNKIASSPMIVTQCLVAVTAKERPSKHLPPIVLLTESYPRWGKRVDVYDCALGYGTLSLYFADRVYEALVKRAMKSSDYTRTLLSFFTWAFEQYPTYSIPKPYRSVYLMQAAVKRFIPPEIDLKDAIEIQRLYGTPFYEFRHNGRIRYSSAPFWQIFGSQLDAEDVIECVTAIVSDAVMAWHYNPRAATRIQAAIWDSLNDNVKMCLESPTGPLFALYMGWGERLYGNVKRARVTVRSLFPFVQCPHTCTERCCDVSDSSDF